MVKTQTEMAIEHLTDLKAQGKVVVTKADMAIASLQEITAREMLLGAKFSYQYGYFEKTSNHEHAGGISSYWVDYFDQQGNPLTQSEVVAIRLKHDKVRKQWILD